MRKTVTVSARGVPIEVWVPLDPSRFASYRPLNGDERYTDPQFSALQQVEFSIRWDAIAATLTPLDRIFYPAISIANPDETVAEARQFEIVDVQETGGRQRGLLIKAVRRTDELVLELPEEEPEEDP